ncbi:carboxymuconolactone decarboxylase family protein [Fructilactobacillus sanfranciscensis]|uniref:carboxymuconolactone decarboxylase family protein n=1 Tax=Fructilactobacillus sanfranciscensis TaxID=1625 RepID=UPI0013D252D5|nr:carboxymuconolactone decarboxylase family protein [Fructilactobacillus sanfranciscensis]NDR77719.1 carboxymuconolactone decarboxylase family protein [Fructilactobacillus sanfranciscensis]
MTEKQTAGHDNFGEFAPKFAELNDDVLFGQVWSRESKLSAKERSLITVTSLLTQGMFGPLEYHMQKAKENGFSKAEMVEAITQLAFYSGWPKAWTAMEMAKKIYAN